MKCCSKISGIPDNDKSGWMLVDECFIRRILPKNLPCQALLISSRFSLTTSGSHPMILPGILSCFRYVCTTSARCMSGTSYLVWARRAKTRTTPNALQPRHLRISNGPLLVTNRNIFIIFFRCWRLLETFNWGFSSQVPMISTHSTFE